MRYVALIVALAATPSIAQPAPSVDLSDETKAQVRDRILSKLRDPESARFGEMRAGLLEDGTIRVCGYVNAKNAFGGYTGNRMFGVEIKKDGRILVGSVGESLSEDICRKYGLFFEPQH